MSDPSPQQARRDQIRDEKRPQQLVTDSATITERTRSNDTQDTFKVYAKEWQHKHTGTKEECEAFFLLKYAGRVAEGDWKVEPAFDDADWFWLSLRIWNVLGEFKYQYLAEEHADRIIAEGRCSKDNIRVVGRNSRPEVELKDYGIKKLVGRARDLRGQASPPAT